MVKCLWYIEQIHITILTSPHWKVHKTLQKVFHSNYIAFSCICDCDWISEDEVFRMKYKVNILWFDNGLWFDNKNAKNVTYKDWKCPDLNVFFFRVDLWKRETKVNKIWQNMCLTMFMHKKYFTYCSLIRSKKGCFQKIVIFENPIFQFHNIKDSHL